MTNGTTRVSELVRKGIDRLRLKLLDLTNRNRLLNFKFSETSRKFVRVIDEIPDLLYERLTDDSARTSRLYFESLPEPPVAAAVADETKPEAASAAAAFVLEPPVAATPNPAPHVRWRRRPDPAARIDAAGWARENGVDPSFDLPGPQPGTPPSKHSDNRIQTLLFPETLERKLAGIREDAKLAQQELGISTLFAAFGYLEWYESPESSQSLYAPLFLLPIQMDRDLKQGRYRYFIESGEGGDPTINVSLRERLKRDFHIELPALNDDDTPDTYIERVKQTISEQKRWKTRRFVVIGHFSFARLVMYEDLAPESWQQLPLEENALISTLLAGAADAATGTIAPEFNVEEEMIENCVPVMITDADSSQFCAVIDAMQGRSFALKGPPGTGKSQTITNLIAAALASRKRVLFVAEKQAALDVVAKRLKDAALEPFLLELHSTKVNKKKVLESLERRMQLPKQRIDRQLATTLAELRVTRAALKAYTETLNSPVGRSEVTLHNAYWLETRARRGLTPEEIEHATALSNSSAVELTRHAYANLEALLGRLGRAHDQCYAGMDSHTRHPLFGVRQLASNPVVFQRFREFLRNWNTALERLERVAGRAGVAFSCEFPSTIAGLKQLTADVRDLKDFPAAADVALLARIRGEPDRQALVAYLALLKGVLVERMAVNAMVVDVDAAVAAVGDVIPHVCNLNALLEDLAAKQVNVHDLPEVLKQQSGEWELAALSLTVLEQFANAAQIPTPLNCAVLAELVDAIELIRSTAPAVLGARNAPLFDTEARGTLEEGALRANLLLGESDAIQAHLALTFHENGGELASAARVLRDTHPVVGLFSGQFRAARRLYRRLSKNRWKGRDLAVAHLLAAADLIDHRRQFEGQESLVRLAGSLYAGLRTPFATLLATVDFCQKVRGRWPTLDVRRAPIQRALLTTDRSLLLDVAEAVGDERLAAVRRLATKSSGTPDELAADRLAALSATNRRAAMNAKAVLAIEHRGLVRACELIGLWHCISQLARLSERLRADAFGSAIPQGRAPEQDDVARVEATLQFATAVLSARIPRQVAAALLSQRTVSALSALRRFSTLVDEGCRTCDRARDAVVNAFAVNLERWYGVASINDLLIKQERVRVGRALAATDETTIDWAIYRSLIERSTGDGLSAFANLLEADSVKPQALPGIFRLAYTRGLIRGASEKNPEIANWTGDYVESLRQRLMELDQEYMRFSRQSLAVALAAAEVPVGISQGSVKTLTERSLVEHEIGKQRRHAPIRELLQRAARATRALKPCFMMSPASVAQFLPPQSEPFDLAIIDEASQMRPEEALGVVARARQIVVVGDPMQLPPTTFFDSSQDDEESQLEEELDVDTESILDLALSSFRPPRDLRWHYRSKHHSLIDFSNHEFYDDRLIVFPSPQAKADDMGVQLVSVPSGVYQSSLNLVEAEVVVRTVSVLMRTSPHSSIGVVAINLPQKDLLLEQFDSLCAREPDLELYREKWRPSLEPFFVKNLENVQGDERDIIVISTVYGPASIGGPVAQRFGPINAAMGHRRLNVLFTRAKERVIVVSSLRPEDIKPPGKASRGVLALKAYLEYARSGRLERGNPTGGSAESPFEAEVAAVLAERGHIAVPQVGVAGYFIDLAVRHPVNTDHFILGIECDGASYHSAKSARDRDLVRQEILERLGWNLHRIWSTDWFNGRDREVRRLLARLDSETSA